MRTLPTFRYGRRFYHDEHGQGDARNSCRRCVDTTVWLLALAGLLIGIPAWLIMAERAYLHRTEALTEVQSEVVELGRARPGGIVHLQAQEVDANVSDPAFGITMTGALRLARETEYCQWEQMTETRRDENNRTYTQYTYYKTWRSHRIPSLLFDQPAAHHNPQRDPYPRQTFTAPSARVVVAGGGDGGRGAPTAILGREMLQETRAPWRHVDWTLGAVPRPRWWWPFRDTTRYEAISSLQGAERSPAVENAGFSYVGQGGYFFSPYQGETSQMLFKYFIQYLEGSLLDWQLGDLMPSCTAGDIRVRFSVQDPPDISVVGKAVPLAESPAATSIWDRFGARGAGTGATEGFNLSPFETPKGHRVGMVHAGLLSFDEMKVAELQAMFWWCLLARCVFLIPVGLVTSRTSLGWRFGLGLWGLCVSCLWIALWGLEWRATCFSASTPVMFCIACGLLVVAFKEPALRDKHN